MTDRWDTCVHEAGHVVAGFCFDIPVLKAIVYKTFKKGRNLGETRASADYEIPARAHIAWFMAGHVAELVINGTPFPEWIEDSPDYIAATHLYPEEYDGGLVMTENFIADKTSSVLQVARLLMDHNGWCSAARLKTAAGGPGSSKTEVDSRT